VHAELEGSFRPECMTASRVIVFQRCVRPRPAILTCHKRVQTQLQSQGSVRDHAEKPRCCSRSGATTRRLACTATAACDSSASSKTRCRRRSFGRIPRRRDDHRRRRRRRDITFPTVEVSSHRRASWRKWYHRASSDERGSRADRPPHETMCRTRGTRARSPRGHLPLCAVVLAGCMRRQRWPSGAPDGRGTARVGVQRDPRRLASRLAGA